MAKFRFKKKEGIIKKNTMSVAPMSRDGQNHQTLMILKSKSNHLNKGDLKSKSKSF